MQFKNEMEAMEDKEKMGIKRIWMIVKAWREQTKMSTIIYLAAV